MHVFIQVGQAFETANILYHLWAGQFLTNFDFWVELDLLAGGFHEHRLFFFLWFVQLHGYLLSRLLYRHVILFGIGCLFLWFFLLDFLLIVEDVHQLMPVPSNLHFVNE